MRDLQGTELGFYSSSSVNRSTTGMLSAAWAALSIHSIRVIEAKARTTVMAKATRGWREIYG